jgi:hypothetical protein
MLPVHEHQAVSCLASAYRVKPGTLEEVLEACSLVPGVRWPFSPQSVRLIPERLPVISEVMFTKPRTSKLFSYLTENPEDVLLVFDAFKSGKDALFFVRLAAGPRDPDLWLSRMTKRTISVHEVGEDTIIAAPANTFAV